MTEIIVYLLRAFFIILKYVPVFLITFLLENIFLKKRGICRKKMLINAAFILYLSALIDIVGLLEMKISISSLFRDGYVMPNLIPFININIKQGAMNVLLFVPFGILVPKVFNKKKKNLTIIIVYALLVSTTIEMLQLCGGRCFDIDDIVMNILGAVIGYAVTNDKTAICEKRKRKLAY
ncbi:MAG: VanZ family protein [Butyrivibrio sp.]|nr:VanZ family protein [Butyrivibrio sp.]